MKLLILSNIIIIIIIIIISQYLKPFNCVQINELWLI